MAPNIHSRPSFFSGNSEKASSATAGATVPSSVALDNFSSADRLFEINQQHLNEAKLSPLFPWHTFDFMSSHTYKELIDIVLHDDVEQFKTNTYGLNSDQDHDYQVLKELLIITALMGSKKVLEELVRFNIKMDTEILNMALWSGKFTGDELNYFKKDKVIPTYNSIRFAILSGNEKVLGELLENHPSLNPTSEHLRAVASVGNERMLDMLKAKGVDVPYNFSLREPKETISMSEEERIHSAASGMRL